MVEYLDGLVRAAARKQHDDKANNPEDSLERKLHYAKANVEQCLHRTINLYVKLIDDRAHTSRLQKKTSDIDSRTVWPSFDIAKVGIILIHATFRKGFCLCRSNESSLWQKEARVSERKRRNCAFVYGGEVRSHEGKRMGSPCRDCHRLHIRGLLGGHPKRFKRSLAHKKGQRPQAAIPYCWVW